MENGHETGSASGLESRFDKYQSSFDTKIVQSTGAGLAIVSSAFRHLVQLVLVGSLAFGCYWVVSHHVLQMVEVSGSSMSPTLRNADYYLLNRLAFFLREPQPNDIVVLCDPVDNRYSVKRIIAREGDSLELKDGKVFINGRRLNEPYLPRGTMTFAGEGHSGSMRFVCGEGQYFVMGDNRNNSADSRSYGAIPKNKILGTILR
ncbi:MAG TPA: signal peptidase I [Verrucomicrobiota bacterium]|nr:signal peptidase I [Verrucomicrobiota bacterium]